MPEEFGGGLDDRCAKSLRAFADAGGVLVFLNAATQYAINRLGIPVKNTVADVKDSDFYSPGSLLNVRLEPHPLSYGLPGEIAIWSQASPAWDIGSASGVVSVARYPSSGILASGWLLEKAISVDVLRLWMPIGRAA
jgi:hypothetical protein